jgi:hypothetical protein
MAMPTFRFDVSAWRRIDTLALKHNQIPHIKDKDNWFGLCREGLWAVLARVYGAQKHIESLYEGKRRIPILDNEYDVSSLWFQMASMLECATFALNALGYAFLPDRFRSLESEKALKDVTWRDVLDKDRNGENSSRGYAKAFPAFQLDWLGR